VYTDDRKRGQKPAAGIEKQKKPAEKNWTGGSSKEGGMFNSSTLIGGKRKEECRQRDKRGEATIEDEKKVPSDTGRRGVAVGTRLGFRGRTALTGGFRSFV